MNTYFAQLFAMAVLAPLISLGGSTAADAAHAVPTHRSKNDQQLRSVIEDAALEIKRFANGRAVQVRAFTGPRSLKVSSGPGLKQMLIHALKRKGLTLSQDAPLLIAGRYILPKDEPRRLELRVRMEDPETGDILDDFQFKKPAFPSAEESAVILGATAVLPTSAKTPPGTPAPRDFSLVKERRKALLQGAGRQRHLPAATSTKIVAKEGGTFAVEFLVGPTQTAKPRSWVHRNGFAFVPLSKGESYTIRLHNNGDFDAAASLHIDGVSIYAFHELKHEKGPKKGEALIERVIVPAKKSVDIVGWRLSDKRSDRFKITTVPEGAASRLGREPDANIGTITATFRACWEKGKSPPKSEPGISRSSLATGFGDPVKVNFHQVSRELGVLRETISVRYDQP